MTVFWLVLAIIQISLVIWGDLNSAYRMLAVVTGAFSAGAAVGRVSR